VLPGHARRSPRRFAAFACVPCLVGAMGSLVRLHVALSCHAVGRCHKRAGVLCRLASAFLAVRSWCSFGQCGAVAVSVSLESRVRWAMRDHTHRSSCARLQSGL
jgi:hypothetical protein